MLDLCCFFGAVTMQQSGALCNGGAGRGFGMRELAPGGSARPAATGEQVVAAQVLTSSSSCSSSCCPPPAHFSHCPPALELFAQELPNFLLHHLHIISLSQGSLWSDHIVDFYEEKHHTCTKDTFPSIQHTSSICLNDQYDTLCLL